MLLNNHILGSVGVCKFLSQLSSCLLCKSKQLDNVGEPTVIDSKCILWQSEYITLNISPRCHSARVSPVELYNDCKASRYHAWCKLLHLCMQHLTNW